MRPAAAVLALSLAACQAANTGGDTAPPADSVAYYNSGKILPTTLPFSEMVRVGNLVFLSGQIGVVPGSMTLVEGGMPAEAKQTMENIKTTLEAHGLSMRHLVKCTVMLADMSEWAAFNEIYRSYFTEPFPARSALGASGLALGARVEVECIASAGTTSRE